MLRRTGGCSEGLDAFRFFFKQSYYNKHVFISEVELFFFNACTVYKCSHTDYVSIWRSIFAQN